MREGCTDARGQVELLDLAAGLYSFALPLGKIRSSVAVVAGRTESFTVVLEAGLQLHGLVVDSAHNAVPDAIVAFDSFRDAPVEVQVDAAGRFELRDVHTPVLVRARAPGQLPTSCRRARSWSCAWPPTKRRAVASRVAPWTRPGARSAACV
jgi:hypothetical protein